MTATLTRPTSAKDHAPPGYRLLVQVFPEDIPGCLLDQRPRHFEVREYLARVFGPEKARKAVLEAGAYRCKSKQRLNKKYFRRNGGWMAFVPSRGT